MTVTDNTCAFLITGSDYIDRAAAWTIRGLVPARGKIFLFPRTSKTGAGAHLDSWDWKQLRREANHCLLPSGAEVKNGSSYGAACFYPQAFVRGQGSCGCAGYGVTLRCVESVLLSSSLCSHTDLIGGASAAHCVQAPSLWVPEYLDVEKW